MTCSIFSKNLTEPICFDPIIFTIFFYYFTTNVFWPSKRTAFINIFGKYNHIIMSNDCSLC